MKEPAGSASGWGFAPPPGSCKRCNYSTYDVIKYSSDVNDIYVYIYIYTYVTTRRLSLALATGDFPLALAAGDFPLHWLQETFPCTGYKAFSLKGAALRGRRVAH